jgi:hypothetical protein
MPKAITINLPHRLSQAEVKVRIESSLAEARQQYPGLAGSLRESWSNNRMDFTLSSMGQTVTGRVEVLVDSVMVQVDLPIFLAMLADSIRSRIETQGRKLLAGPG